MKRIITVLGLAVGGLALTTTSANAVSSVNAIGTGFVPKGDVQSAFGWNNSVLQQQAEKLTFSTSQSTSQPLSSTATQYGMQDGTQVVTQDLSCTYTNGSDNNTKYFHREGTRRVTRDAERDGSRIGSRAGSITGKVASDVAYEARKQNQFTGFNLKGWAVGSPVTTTGPEAWDAASETFGAWQFGAWDVEVGVLSSDIGTDVDWSDWQAAPGSNPADCDRSQNADKITEYNSVLTGAEPTEGLVHEGDVEYGTTQYGTTQYSPVVLSVTATVNGVTTTKALPSV